MSGTIDRREAMAVAASLPLALSISANVEAASAPAPSVGRDQPFDNGWRFFRGVGDGFENPAFADGTWRKVDLPHDWSIEDLPDQKPPNRVGPFDRSAPGGTGTGFAEGGEGWYRKHFRVDSYPKDARIEIGFDGIYCESDVWINGERIGGSVHGYAPFACDLTPHLRRDADNVIAVRVRNLGQNSRWYSGSGLYRQVKLDVLPASTRIAHWGVAAWTKRIADGVAEIDVTTQIETPDPTLMLHTLLRGRNGAVVAMASAPATGQVHQTLVVKAPALWSPDTPNLYSLETELRRGGSVVDHMVQPFGVRITTFDAKHGLTINGKPTRLRGGCIHHDNGLLGAAAFADADERRIRLLKARGYNAIRSSHNPSSRSLRDACDRLGMLMVDEAFDMWHAPKRPDDFSTKFRDHWEGVVTAMVLSARNSPSVILWSIGNEIPERTSTEGMEWSWKLANKVRTLDPTRPVTAAVHGLVGAPMTADSETARPGRGGKPDNASVIFLDVPGYNYRLEDIENEEREHPERIIYASETYPKDAYDYQSLVERAPYFLGEFVWTAMDYLGEAGIGAAVPVKSGVPFYVATYPWVNAYCGDIDLIGGQKAASRYRDVVWGLSPIEMAVQRPVPEGKVEFVGNWAWSDELQSWNWAEAGDKPLAVRLYSRGDKVELLLNGKSVGTKALTPADKTRAEFKLPFEAGVLEAVAYKGGKVIGRKRLETVGAPAKLHVAAERATGGSDRQALHYVAIEVTDAQGRSIPDDIRKISLSVTGPAELVGFGSANPKAVGSFQSREAESFNGRALAILRSTGSKGAVRIEARSGGLIGGSTRITLA